MYNSWAKLGRLLSETQAELKAVKQQSDNLKPVRAELDTAKLDLERKVARIKRIQGVLRGARQDLRQQESKTQDVEAELRRTRHSLDDTAVQSKRYQDELKQARKKITEQAFEIRELQKNHENPYIVGKQLEEQKTLTNEVQVTLEHTQSKLRDAEAKADSLGVDLRKLRQLGEQRATQLKINKFEKRKLTSELHRWKGLAQSARRQRKALLTNGADLIDGLLSRIGLVSKVVDENQEILRDHLVHVHDLAADLYRSWLKARYTVDDDDLGLTATQISTLEDRAYDILGLDIEAAQLQDREFVGRIEGLDFWGYIRSMEEILNFDGCPFDINNVPRFEDFDEMSEEEQSQYSCDSGSTTQSEEGPPEHIKPGRKLGLNGFRGVDVDMVELVQRVQKQGERLRITMGPHGVEGTPDESSPTAVTILERSLDDKQAEEATSDGMDTLPPTLVATSSAYAPFEALTSTIGANPHITPRITICNGNADIPKGSSDEVSLQDQYELAAAFMNMQGDEVEPGTWDQSPLALHLPSPVVECHESDIHERGADIESFLVADCSSTTSPPLKREQQHTEYQANGQASIEDEEAEPSSSGATNLNYDDFPPHTNAPRQRVSSAPTLGDYTALRLSGHKVPSRASQAAMSEYLERYPSLIPGNSSKDRHGGAEGGGGEEGGMGAGGRFTRVKRRASRLFGKVSGKRKDRNVTM